MNAEVICHKRDWEEVRNVGVTQGRENEKYWAQKTYPQIEEFTEVIQKGIFYSMERGEIDAAIQDITKAAGVPQYSCMPVSDSDYISYVLVVNKEFSTTPAFADFVLSYNEAVRRLQDTEYLAGKLDVSEEWMADKKVTFLFLDELEE